jgi:phosphopentomutase
VNRRAILIVLDGVGAGAARDANEYGDAGSNTLGNVADAVGGLDLPALESLGLGRAIEVRGLRPDARARGSWGTMHPASPGKDSTTGHWEIAGVHLDRPFPTYPDGFPASVIEEFSRGTGRRVIGNVAGSGTAMIDTYWVAFRRRAARAPDRPRTRSSPPATSRKKGVPAGTAQRHHTRSAKGRVRRGSSGSCPLLSAF